MVIDNLLLLFRTRLARTVMAGQQLEKRTDWKIPLEVSSMNLPGKSVFWPIITKAKST